MLLNRIRLSRCAILAALGVVLLYIAGIVPTATLGLCAAAGVTVVAAVIVGGLKGGVLTYAVTSMLSFLLVPKSGIMYIVLFGIYSIIKSVAERTRGNVLPWVIKIVSCNILVSVLLYAGAVILPLEYSETTLKLLLAYAAVNIIFIIYDIGLSGLITLFVKRLGRFFV